MSINEVVLSNEEEMKIDTYTVKSSDTIEKIAKMYGISVEELKRLNNQTSNMIYTNEILRII